MSLARSWPGLAWCAAAALAACGPADPAGREGRAAVEQRPERQKVRAFWQALHDANDARLRGDCAGGLALYAQALALDPQHEDALYYLGQCLRELGRPGEARAVFERLVAANDASARGHLALGALLASPDPHEPMDLAAAERHLRRAHAVNGEETGPVLRLGEVLLLTGRQPEAGRAFEAALRTNPKSLEAALLAGFVAWDAPRGGDRRRLAARLRDAARVDAPVRGVLNEGDRRDAQRAAAPPLESPLGRLLFADPVTRIRQRAAAGQPIDDAFVEGVWRETRLLRDGLRARSRQ